MAAYVDRSYCGWSHEDLPDQNESKDVSVSQMLDHGSISFGRFALESLSWEKWSVFTHNRCQEELEKFKSPGLVAQKKAYFEEYYKNMRAMKAVQKEQQTEITLDYGGDGSISSQTGEDDGAAVQLEESLVDGGPIMVDACTEEAPTEVVLDKGKECNEVLQVGTMHLDLEIRFPNIDSQTEILVETEQNYGDDGSISSQTGENDETAVQLEESLGDGGPHIVDSSTEEAPAEVSVDDRKDCNKVVQVQTINSDLETQFSNIDSQREILMESEQEMNTSCALPIQHLEAKSALEKSLMITSTGETEQHEPSNLDEKEVSRKFDVETEAASQASEVHPMNSKKEDSELKLALAKIKPAARVKKGHVSVSKTKESSATVRNDLKSDSKMKSCSFGSSHAPKYPSQKTMVKIEKNVSSSKAAADRVSNIFSVFQESSATVRIDLKLDSKMKSCSFGSSHAPKYPSQKTMVKMEKNVSSRKAAADRVSSNYKSASVASHKLLKERQSNITVPRPFSLATDRRAAIPPGIREGAVRSESKTLNRLASPSVHGKDSKNVKGTLKRTVVTCCTNSKGLEKKRCHEERKKPLASDSQYTSFKGRGANVLGPPKSRSINLPVCGKLTPKSEIENRLKDVGGDGKCQGVREETSLRGFKRPGTKVTPCQVGNLRTETKKEMVPSQTSKLSLNGRKPRFGEQSLDEKKPRQEKPRWR